MEYGEPEPEVLRIAKAVDRYGVEAVTGNKTISTRMSKDIDLAEMVVKAYVSRARAENVAEWIGTHAAEQRLLEASRADWKEYAETIMYPTSGGDYGG